MREHFLSIVVVMLVLAGCAAPSPTSAPGHVYQQSQPIANFKNSDRRRIERVAILYPGAQTSELQDHVVTQLADAFFTRGVGYTTARVDNELSIINAATYLRRFEPSHILRVYVPMQRHINGQLVSYRIELHLIDTGDGAKVWAYQAEVRVGETTSVRSVVQSALAEMERDGVVRDVRPNTSIDADVLSAGFARLLPAGHLQR